MSSTSSQSVLVLTGLAFIVAPMLLAKVAGALGADGKTEGLVWVCSTPVIIIIAQHAAASSTPITPTTAPSLTAHR